MTNYIVSAIGVLVAVIALIQTSYQIRLHNKHELFQKRLNCFYNVRSLLNNYGSVKDRIKAVLDKDVVGKFDLILILLTFNFEMKEAQMPLYNFEKSDDFKSIYDVIEKQSRLKYEMNFVFPRKIRREAVAFLQGYADVISAIIKYKIGIFQYDNVSDDTYYAWVREFTSNCGVNGIDGEIVKRLDNLNNFYETIVKNNIETKIAKCIKL